MYDYRKCAKCKYSGKLNENQLCCLYILVEGHMRGCYDGDKCTKYKRRTRFRRASLDMEDGRWFYVYEEK